MSREVIKYSFNRNHVRIYTITNPEGTSMEWASPRYDIMRTASNKNVISAYRTIKEKTGKNYVDVKKQSPLGFYYTKREYFPAQNSIVDEDSVRVIHTLSFYDSEKKIHILTFYTQYGENVAAKTEDGLRPWEICDGDNSMPDHMLNDLFEEVNSFFKMMEIYKIEKVYNTTNGRTIYNAKQDYSIHNVKKEIFEYLFGSIKGIRFQTDLEKIISHGFDPKYSFRKDKEKK